MAPTRASKDVPEGGSLSRRSERQRELRAPLVNASETPLLPSQIYGIELWNERSRTERWTGNYYLLKKCEGRGKGRVILGLRVDMA